MTRHAPRNGAAAEARRAPRRDRSRGALVALRTAIVSDIHGNAVGLRALLADLEGQAADQVVCLGDVAQGGPNPTEVLDAVLAQGWRVVMGNADAFLLDAEASSEPTTPRHLEMREWSRAQLGDERLDYIATFSPTVEAALGHGETLLAFHGSPGSFDDIILPSLDEESHSKLLDGHEADVFAGGHVHVQWLRRLGPSVFVNPGSVGLSYDHSQPEDDFRFDPWAAYALLETDEAGSTEMSFRRVPFDYREVVHVLQDSGMPHADFFTWRWKPRASESHVLRA